MRIAIQRNNQHPLKTAPKKVLNVTGRPAQAQLYTETNQIRSQFHHADLHQAIEKFAKFNMPGEGNIKLESATC